MTTILSSKNNSPLSYLIRWATGESASHIAICFDDKVVFHSNLFGAHPIFKTTFLKKNQIVDEVLVTNHAETEELIWQQCIRFDGRRYDYLALIYFAVALLFKERPRLNAWNNDKMYICTEIAKAIKPVVDFQFDLAMMTPSEVIKSTQEHLYGKTSRTT